jgi:RNA polymerase primary sigma factor
MGVRFKDALRPEEELHLAKQIKRCELRLWSCLLTFAPQLRYLQQLIGPQNPDLPAEAEALSQAAEAAIAQRSRRAQRHFLKRALQAAKHLQQMEHSRTLLRKIVSELQRDRAHNHRWFMDRGELKSYNAAPYLKNVLRLNGELIRLENAFVKGNIGLVIVIAKRYSQLGLPMADLVQEGNLGLIKALERYDPGRNTRFSTYAAWWIRHYMLRAVQDKSRTVRVPVYLQARKQQASHAWHELYSKLDRPPELSEVAEQIDLPLAQLEQIYSRGRECVISLDEPLGGTEDQPLLEIFTDPQKPETSAFDEIANKLTMVRVNALVNELTPIEADIIRRRFGLYDQREWSLRELGNVYHLSRERIRQIQNEALSKIRRRMELQRPPLTKQALS